MATAIEGMEDIVQEFLVEGAEEVELLDRDLVALEREPGSPELLAEIFRAVHTLKGNSGALGFSKLESVAHAGESLLAALRDGKLALTPKLTNGLLAMVDALRSLLRAIEENGSEDEGNYTSVVDLLRGLADEFAAANKASTQNLAPPSTLAPENRRDAVGASTASVRVGVGLLDHIMNLVGELVLARNQVLHVAAASSDVSVVNAAQRLKSATSGLQESVMKARMEPIGNLWNKLPRLVRDIAAHYGKQIALEMKGSEIELDRTILEAIKDPLIHILRNAIDHGIESAEQRAKAGKTAAGHVRLSAFHEGGRVHVEISDDGAGINLPRVRQRAVERGMITAEEAAAIGERELTRLVFTPSFSTAEAVTNISGRGVGLDVVRTNIERIGGAIDLESVAGQGTILKINLPLTLAILPALIVSSGGERFAIPQASLLELVALEVGEQNNRIEQICGAPVYRWRHGLLPLVFLDCQLQLPRQNAGAMNIVVLQAGAQPFGLVVDAIGDTEEIVVKPLSHPLKRLSCFAGAAILGDGHVVLILDVTGVAQLANLATAGSAPEHKEATAIEVHPDPARQCWVTFRQNAGRRFALPMSAVARLEEIPAEKVERSRGREVVQYCGEILPLLRTSDLFHEPASERDLLQVLVLREAGPGIGLVVDRIEDIVEQTVELHGGETGWLQGTTVIDERVADMLDLKRVLAGEPYTPAAAAAGDR